MFRGTLDHLKIRNGVLSVRETNRGGLTGDGESYLKGRGSPVDVYMTTVFKIVFLGSSGSEFQDTFPQSEDPWAK